MSEEKKTVKAKEKTKVEKKSEKPEAKAVTTTVRERKAIQAFREKLEKKAKKSKAARFWINAAWCLVLLAWVFAVLYASQYLIAWILVGLFHITDSGMNNNAIQAVFTAITYLVAVTVTIFVPWLIIKNKTTREELGIRGLPTWSDLLLAPIGFIVFMFVATILLALLQKFLPGVDWQQNQNVGFSNLLTQSDFMLTFVMLVIVAPIAEEVIFRGWLYGKLRAKIPAIPAIILVSILFGIVHGQWNVGVTVFVMSIVMCTLREITGTIWGGVLLHIIKNGVAFYFLYVNPIMIQ